MKTMTDYLDEYETKEEFFERVYKKGESYEAREQAKSAVRNLDYFCKEKYGKTEEEILSDLQKNPNIKKIVQILKGFVLWCGKDHPDIKLDKKRHMKKKSSGTIRPYLTQIRKYFKFCYGIRINDDDYRDYVLDIIGPSDEQEVEPLKKEELRAIIDNAPNPRRKTLYMVAKDTAGRLKELLQLKKENFDFTKKHPVVIFPKGITKGKRRKKETYLTPETAPRVKILLNSLKDEDYVFSTNPNSIKSAKQNEEAAWKTLVIRLGYKEKYSNGRLKKNFHSIRAFTETQVKQATKDRDFADFYAGNKRYLSQYIRLEDKEKEELFERCIPKLSVYEKFEVVDSDERIGELEKKLEEFENKERIEDEEIEKALALHRKEHPKQARIYQAIMDKTRQDLAEAMKQAVMEESGMTEEEYDELEVEKEQILKRVKEREKNEQR